MFNILNRLTATANSVVSPTTSPEEPRCKRTRIEISASNTQIDAPEDISTSSAPRTMAALFRNTARRSPSPPPDDFPSNEKDFMNLEAISFLLTVVKFKIDIQGSNLWGICLGKQSRMRVRKVHQAMLEATGKEHKQFLNGVNMPQNANTDRYAFLQSTKKVATSTIERVVKARLPLMNQMLKGSRDYCQQATTLGKLSALIEKTQKSWDDTKTSRTHKPIFRAQQH